MNAATNTTPATEPFTSLTAAIDFLDAADLCGTLTFILGEVSKSNAARIEEATDALQTAESVETMSDFVTNLREVVAALVSVKAAKKVVAKIERTLGRCV